MKNTKQQNKDIIESTTLTNETSKLKKKLNVKKRRFEA